LTARGQRELGKRKRRSGDLKGWKLEVAWSDEEIDGELSHDSSCRPFVFGRTSMQQTLFRRTRPPGDGSAFFMSRFGLPVEAVHHFFEIAGRIVRPITLTASS